MEDLPAEKDEENWFRRLGAREALSRVECWKVKVLKFLKKLNLHSWVKLRLRKKRLLPFVGFRHPPETFWVVVIVEAMGDPLPNLPLKLLIIFKQLALLPFLVAEWFLKSHQLLIFPSLVRPLIRHDNSVVLFYPKIKFISPSCPAFPLDSQPGSSNYELCSEIHWEM